jgi:hypothetical protein
MDLEWPPADVTRAWFRDINYGQDGMRANELMFLAQQLWSSLPEAIESVSNLAGSVDGSQPA